MCQTRHNRFVLDWPEIMAFQNKFEFVNPVLRNNRSSGTDTQSTLNTFPKQDCTFNVNLIKGTSVQDDH